MGGPQEVVNLKAEIAAAHPEYSGFQLISSDATVLADDSVLRAGDAPQGSELTLTLLATPKFILKTDPEDWVQLVGCSEEDAVQSLKFALGVDTAIGVEPTEK